MILNPPPPTENPVLPEKKQMKWVGHHDLQGRPGYQPTIHQQGGRYIAYIGHHTGLLDNPLTGVQEWSGTSIVDVTDPVRPLYVAHIPGPVGGVGEAGGAQMVRVCSGSVLPNADRSKVYILRTLATQAHEIWDTTDPAKPQLVKTILSGLTGTHKNWWECDSGIAYLVAGAGPTAANPDGWKSSQHLKIYNLSNPAAPQYVRDFGLAGSNPVTTTPMPGGGALHGPISVPAKNRVYLAWGTTANGVVQIVDRSKLLPPPLGTAVLTDPASPTDAELLAPQVGRLDMQPDQGAHTTFPVFGIKVPGLANFSAGATRDVLITLSETYIARCQNAYHSGWVVDMTFENKLWPIASIDVDDMSATPNYCSRGARFGAHATNESFYAPWYGKLVATSWFNAGVRIWDIRDPRHPQEAAYFVPLPTAKTTATCAPGMTTDCKVNIMTNNVELDDRGLIYAIDRVGTGLEILALSGAAAAIVGDQNTWQDLNGKDD